MDKYKSKWTRLQNDLFGFLCIRAGQSFNLRGLARHLKVSPTAVSKALIGLEKLKLIVVEKSKTMNLFDVRFNRDNHKAIEFKRVENLRLIYGSGLVDFLEESFPGCTIVLFGSYSKGEDVVGSDVDIAVIGSKEKKIDLTSFDKLFQRSVFINFYSDWRIDGELKNNIRNGITLRGNVE